MPLCYDYVVSELRVGIAVITFSLLLTISTCLTQKSYINEAKTFVMHDSKFFSFLLKNLFYYYIFYNPAPITEVNTLAMIIINAPPSLLEIWEKGIRLILLAAPKVAISPEPPILAIHNPAVIADSTG